MYTGINVIDFNGGIKTADSEISVDFIELDINDSHTITTMSE